MQRPESLFERANQRRDAAHSPQKRTSRRNVLSGSRPNHPTTSATSRQIGRGSLLASVVHPRLAPMRGCTKVGCAREAAASCGFSYAEREVWIAPLSAEPQPSQYDLCDSHAATLRVPRGWTLRDLRERSATDVFGRFRAQGARPAAVREVAHDPDDPHRADQPAAGASDVPEDPPAQASLLA